MTIAAATAVGTSAFTLEMDIFERYADTAVKSTFGGPHMNRTGISPTRPVYARLRPGACLAP